MLTLPITYVNFNGRSITKNFFFNITKAEIALRELESDGTWTETLKQIQESSLGSVVMPEFKKIIKWCYGEKSMDGESFEKSDEIYAKFENSEAWSVLIMNLLTQADFSTNFIKGVMPPQAADGVTPGFRPGASTDRPTPPGVTGENNATTPTNPVFAAISEPVLPEPTPTPEPIAEPVPATAPVQTQVDPANTPAEAPIQQISTPRQDLMGGIS